MSIQSQYDFVIVGAGQNQLSLGAYLAAAGASVVLLEKDNHWGGGASSAEVTLPGFIHDIHATNIFLAQANPLIKDDELELKSRFGLKFAEKNHEPAQGTVFDDGSVIALYRDVERSCESIARYSPEDVEAYHQFVKRTSGYMNVLEFALFRPPPNPETLLNLLRESTYGREFLDYLNASAWSLITSYFKEPRTQIHVLRLMSEMVMDPTEPGTALGLMLMLGLYHRYPSGLAMGGSQKFSDALADCLKHHGGEIHLNQEVTSVDVQHFEARGVVLASGERIKANKAVIGGFPPWHLNRFVEGTEMLSHKARHVPTSDFTVFLSHLALAEAPRPNCDSEYHRMGFTALCQRDPELILDITSKATRGHISSEFSAAYVCGSIHDPSRAPEGKHTLYLYHIVPTQLAEGGMDGWTAKTDEFGQWMIDKTRGYVPNLSEENILGVTHCSPKWIADSSPSYKHGDVAGIGMFPDQFIYGRPITELKDYRVPGVKNLYLCGPFMHPGGGANGGGRAAAMTIMQDHGMPLASVFNY